eukprot:scaffold64412_cov31-Tisochrysis_lutea.AAC.3
MVVVLPTTAKEVLDVGVRSASDPVELVPYRGWRRCRCLTTADKAVLRRRSALLGPMPLPIVIEDAYESLHRVAHDDDRFHLRARRGC